MVNYKLPKYLFYFEKDSPYEILFRGKEIADYWNSFYDLFFEKGKMIIQKTNGCNFSKIEIKKLFWDLYEDMGEDMTILDLKIISSSTIILYNLGELYLPLHKPFESILDEEWKIIGANEENARYKKSLYNLNNAFERYKKKNCFLLSKGFEINNPLLLNTRKYFYLKRDLNYYQKAISDDKNWTFYLYYILDKKNLSNELKQIRGKLNDESKYGSRHESLGFRKNISMKKYSKSEKNLCFKSVKNLINSWIEKSGINMNK